MLHKLPKSPSHDPRNTKLRARDIGRQREGCILVKVISTGTPWRSFSTLPATANHHGEVRACLAKAQQDSGFTIPNRVVECGSSVHDVRTSNQIRTRIFKSLTSIPNSDNLAAKRRLLRALCSCCRLDVLDENLRSSRCSPVVAAIDFWGKAQTSSTLPGGIQQHNFRCAAESLV